MPRRERNATGGVGFDGDRFGVELANFVMPRIATLDQATWNAFVDARTDAQVIAMCRALLKGLPDFDNTPEPT